MGLGIYCRKCSYAFLDWFFRIHSPQADPNGDMMPPWGFCLGFYGDDLPGVDVVTLYDRPKFLPH